MDLPAIKIRRHIFLKNPAILALKPAFSKIAPRRRAGVQPPSPLFLRRHAIGEANEALHFQFSLVSPSLPDGDSVSAEFLKQLLTVGAVRPEILPTKGYRHLEVDAVGINALRRLFDNCFPHNSACEVEHCQRRPYLLLCESVPFAMEIHQAQRVFQVTKAGFNSPAQMIQFPDVLQCECARKRRGDCLKLSRFRLEPDNAYYACPPLQQYQSKGRAAAMQ